MTKLADCATCGSTDTTVEHRRICAYEAQCPVRTGDRVRITGGRYRGLEVSVREPKKTGWIKVHFGVTANVKEVWVHPDNWVKA
jgi:hypothetical protein